MTSVADLIRYRMKHERYIHRRSETVLQTPSGPFRAIWYSSDIEPERHLALVRGDLTGPEPVLVRMHSHCLYGDVFGSTNCECQDLIRGSLQQIAKEERGVLVYLHQNGPGLRMNRVPQTPTSSMKTVSGPRFFRTSDCTRFVY